MEGLQQSVNSTTLPMTEEPVVVGPKCDATQKLPLNGIRIHQTVHVELLKRAGDVITLRTTITQTAPSRRSTAPNLPPGKL